MALQMTDKAAMETLRARLSLRAAARAAARHPAGLAERAADGPAASSRELFPDVTRRAGDRRRRGSPLDPLPPPGLAGASNAFAATGTARPPPARRCWPPTRTSALSAPSIWMLARMDLAEGPVIGGTIPGIPAVLVGRNADLGWGLTASYLDDQDVYIERLEPDRPRTTT